jgi:hypothetical protein
MSPCCAVVNDFTTCFNESRAGCHITIRPQMKGKLKRVVRDRQETRGGTCFSCVFTPIHYAANL